MADTSESASIREPATRAGRDTSRQQRWLLAGVLVAVGAFGLWNRWSEHRGIEVDEAQQLTAQAQAVDETLSRQLTAAAAAMRGVRDDLGAWSADEVGMRVSRRLKALCDAMPGVRSMLLLDRNGRALGANLPGLIGQDFGDRDHFRQARAQPDPQRLSLSPPFANADGSHTMNLTIALVGADGGFGGVITATLDADYFRVALRATRYAPDVSAAVVHGDGDLLMIEPHRDAVAGLNLDQPGSLFRLHRKSGRPDTLMTGPMAATGDVRTVAQRTVWPAGLSLDTPLVIAVSRNVEAMYAPWWRQTALAALLYGMLVATASLALAAIGRRQRAIDRLQVDSAAAQRLSAERLELALRGADLGLWDRDVPSGHSYVNERWNSMLGLPHQPVYADSVGWASRVHPEDWQRVEEAFRAHLDGRSERFDEVYRMQHADGGWRWILDRGQVLERDAHGAPLRMVGTHMDVTETMEGRLALERSERNLATTLQSIGDAVVATDPRGVIVRMNPTAERMTGWRLDEAAGRALGEVFRIFNARTREPASDPVAQVIARGEVVGLANDTLLVARDGREYQIADSAAPIRGPDGAISGVVLVFSDVTESYRVQEALRVNEQRLRSLLENLSCGVVVHDAATRVIEANPTALRLLGLTLDQMLGKAAIDPYWTFVEDDGSPMALERYPVNQVVSSDAALKDLLLGIRRPGTPQPAWVMCNAAPMHDAEGRLTQVVVTITDISERRQVEDQLQLFAASLARLNDMVIITEADPVEAPGPRMVYVNDAFERHTGWTRDEVLGRSPRILQGDKTDRAELARIGAALRRGEPVHAELVNYTKQGADYWVEFDIVPIVDRSGRTTHLVAVQRIVTERKEAEQRILAARGELEATLAAIPDLLFDLGLDGTYHAFHSPRRDLLFPTPGGFIGRRVAEVLPPEAAAVVLKALQQANTAGFSAGLQYELTLPQGPCWFELSVARKSLQPGEAPRFIALVRDVTERKDSEVVREALERQLREAQKMESIGTFAGGIAHDFNNILAAILGNVSLARADVPAGHPVVTSLEQIERAGLRARHLVQQILAFSRREQLGLRNQPLAPIVEEAFELMRAILPAGVRLEHVAPEHAVTVRGDSTQLQQVLVNLCTNAWHALPERGGRIEVGHERVVPDEDLRQRLPDVGSRAWAHLWVRDNGSGMDEATRQRIFDPFFTTKPVGQGTGLGLSVVHGIVRAHKGLITVDTAPGRGTTVHLYVASPEPDEDGEPVPVASGPAVQGHGQHVLYIDDDDIMAPMVERLLERAGFRVTTAGDAKAALAQVGAGPSRFDAVVTDFNMPDLSGLDVARQLARIRPGLPVVISSGYLSDELRVQARKAGVRALLQKENTLEELVGLLHALLSPAP